MLIYPTTRLALFLDAYDIAHLDKTCQLLSGSQEWIFETTCGMTSNSLAYLLDSRYPKQTTNISEGKLYKIVLLGVNANGEVVYPDHVLHLIFDQGRWIMFDSYVDCRVVSCLSININVLINQLNQLAKQFDRQIWKTVTGCTVYYSSAVKVKVTLIESTYTLNYVDERFWRLIDLAQIRLRQGVDNSHLSLLSPSLDKDKAERYLNSLLDLIPNRSWIKKMNSYVYWDMPYINS